MRIPQIDLSAQLKQLKPQLMAGYERVIDSGQFILGTFVEEFETKIANWTGVSHAVGCASGTDALVLALLALDIGPGDEVITSPFSFFASGGAIARVGAKPVFADIDSATYTLDPEKVKAAISERTKAIIPVHIFGQMADMDALKSLAEQHELKIIEDAAQSIGATWNGGQAGTIGDIGCFSFYPTKNLNAAGDAGMLSTNNARLANRLRALRSHGEYQKYQHSEVGLNSRLSALNAVTLTIKLDHLSKWNDRRREIAGIYDKLFAEADIPAGAISTPVCASPAKHVYHQYSIRLAPRDELRAYLAGEGIGTAIHYPGLIYHQPCFDNAAHWRRFCPVAEETTRQILSLPMYAELEDEQVVEVVKQIERFFKQ